MTPERLDEIRRVAEKRASLNKYEIADDITYGMADAVPELLAYVAELQEELASAQRTIGDLRTQRANHICERSLWERS